jgi:hypothetical protein
MFMRVLILILVLGIVGLGSPNGGKQRGNPRHLPRLPLPRVGMVVGPVFIIWFD